VAPVTEQDSDDTVLAQVARRAAPERHGKAPSPLTRQQRDILAVLVTNATGSWI